MYDPVCDVDHKCNGSCDTRTNDDVCSGEVYDRGFLAFNRT